VKQKFSGSQRGRVCPLATRPEQVQAAADAAKLTLVTETLTTEQEWRQSPNEDAQQVEARAFPALLDLDDSTFVRVAQPITARLRALPEPDRPRLCAARHPLLIVEKTVRSIRLPRPDNPSGPSRRRVTGGRSTEQLARTTLAAAAERRAAVMIHRAQPGPRDMRWPMREPVKGSRAL
jgi:hypothetical protein